MDILRKWILIALVCTWPLQPAALIFDCGGVLFAADKTASMRRVGYSVIALYALLLNNPFKIQDRFFAMLNTLPFQPHAPVKTYYRLQENPPVILNWLLGTQTCAQILAAAHTAIERSDAWVPEKDLFHALTDLTFDPVIHTSITIPIGAGHELVRMCAQEKDAQGNKKHQLFILSNYNQEIFRLIEQEHSAFFSLFDAIFISGDYGDVKPSPSFFKTVLTKYNLNPQDCHFIDDQLENILTADALHMHTYHCANEQDLSTIQTQWTALGIISSQL